MGRALETLPLPRPDTRWGYGNYSEAPQHRLLVQGAPRCSLSSDKMSTALSCDPGSSLLHP